MLPWSDGVCPDALDSRLAPANPRSGVSAASLLSLSKTFSAWYMAKVSASKGLLVVIQVEAATCPAPSSHPHARVSGSGPERQVLVEW